MGGESGEAECGAGGDEGAEEGAVTGFVDSGEDHGDEDNRRRGKGGAVGVGLVQTVVLRVNLGL